MPSRATHAMRCPRALCHCPPASQPHSRRPRSYLKQLSSVLLNKRLTRESHLLQLLRIRCRDLRASDTNRWRVQVVKSVFSRQGNNLSADAERREARFHDHHGAGFLHGLDDGLDVHGLDGAEVDDFGFDAVFLLQVLGGYEGLADAAGEGDDCEVFSWALDLGFAELVDTRQHGTCAVAC
jgi:hypothetical protein